MGRSYSSNFTVGTEYSGSLLTNVDSSGSGHKKAGTLFCSVIIVCRNGIITASLKSVFLSLSGDKLNSVFPVFLVNNPDHFGIGIQWWQIIVGVIQLDFNLIPDIKTDTCFYGYGHSCRTDVETFSGQLFSGKKDGVFDRDLHADIC